MPRIGSTTGAVVALAAAALLIAGCATTVGGSPTAGSPSPSIVPPSPTVGTGTAEDTVSTDPSTGTGTGSPQPPRPPSNTSEPTSTGPGTATSPQPPSVPLTVPTFAPSTVPPPSSPPPPSRPPSTPPPTHPPVTPSTTTLTVTASPTDAPGTSDGSGSGTPPDQEFVGATQVDPAGYPGLVTPVGFSSPSGNITCGFQPTQTPSVICQIQHHTYTPPAGDCGGAGAWGSTVTVAVGAGPAFLCAGGVEGGGPALAYGSAITISGLECVSREDGVTCRDRTSGSGFRVATAAFLLF